MKDSFLVAAGILLSRIMGLVRQRVFLYYFGLSLEADAFTQALRIPNFLQTLFGEGVLSASFIPVYASLVARGDEEEAGRVAGAIGAILAVLTSVLVLLGVLLTPYLIDVIAFGFTGEKRELTIRIVRILFPGVGLLVMSAWCLGILNSHRRFFLSYTAPVIWNIAMIATLLWYGASVELDRLAILLAWGAVVGSALQFGVQLPSVLRLVKRLRLSLDTAARNVRIVIGNFVPVFFGRGVVQVSAFIDSILASLLPISAVSGLASAQLLYTLPVSLFGMSVSAAELPTMSSAVGDAGEVAAYLRRRLNAGLRQIAFFIVPSSMAFLALGDMVAAAALEAGQFKHADSLYVWGILAGSTVGLLASTLGRLYSSTYYALRDTRTPLRYALIRVTLTAVLGYAASIWLPRWLGLEQRWGAAGLTASAGVAGWVEFTLLRRTLNARIGSTGVDVSFLAKLWTAASLAAAAGWAVKWGTGSLHPIVQSVAVLAAYGVTYFAIAAALRIEEPAQFLARLRRRR